MKLNAKLVLIMMLLLLLVMLALFLLNQHSQNALVEEIQDSSQEISKAVQLSIADLTSEAEHSRLMEYLQDARHKGINEINIIDIDGEIIDSSNPEKIGKKRDLKKLETGMKKPSPAERRGSILTQKPYEVVVPVIIGDEHWGYVQINMLLDNIRDIQRANFIKRLVATCLVFAVGIAVTIYLARRYTEPIQRLVQDFKKVSAGDLSVTLPVESNDEIGELAQGFNEMVEKLRERETLEKRLYEAEHLSRVGQLASGIAHEIRNPLNYISLAIDHLRNEVVEQCPERAGAVTVLADKIRDEVRRANYMVVNFMNYGRPLKLRKALVNYGELLERILSVLGDRLAEQRVTVVQQLADDLPLLYLDGELLRNCITNFITNAAQAMPEGGSITLGAELDGEPGWVRLSFGDQGCGIAPEDLDKIFQPYVTSKEVGIGLGLAITERIIKEHGGEILVASRPGQGTIFTVRLPMEEEAA
ncbi:sensor histidine kinase [Trichlorobacter sp.]|uniref:sensor histidine kinase n=1 Tax=Trichlorobacter sp. TaxID=2911007 RepID=UPI002A36E696|nr:ATP-binding protein [Trichlorobacter sp.]MDY0383747.1 ATP-binding protein [Trichlorobacter sp.]